MRLFIAIGLPDSVKQSLLAIQPPAGPGIRRIEYEDLHLTLHFLGELSEAQSIEVRRSLETVRQEAFIMEVRGVGVFPAKGDPRVLWAGIVINPRLQSLHRRIGDVLREEVDYQVEQRPFAPHITIARLKERCRIDSVIDCLNRNHEIHLGHVNVTKFGLYSSQFENGVPQYREEATFGLQEEVRNHPHAEST